MRIQANVVAVQERRFLNFCCSRMPAWVSPNSMSAVGALGACLVFVGYAASTVRPAFLWLATFGIVLNWFGDSLDGSLARWRQTERPLFGHFFDHSLDALGNSLMLLGLGTCIHVRMDIAMAALAGYLLMTIHVLLKQKAEGVFQISFVALGPTELRLVLALMTIAMWVWGSTTFLVGGIPMTPYDLIMLFAAIAFGLIYVFETARVSRRLSLLDPPKAPPVG